MKITKSELKKLIVEVLSESAKPINAKGLLKYLVSEKGNDFKVNFTGAWDLYSIKSAKIITINRGSGFEDAIAVSGSEGGVFIYFGPFKLESEPTEESMLLFHADSDSFYIKKI